SHAHPTVFDPSAPMAGSIGGSGNRRPGHTHPLALQIKTMHRPLLARVRIDGRACLEGALLALAQDPVAFVLGAGPKGPTGNDRASEWHHEQFFGTNCGGADGEEDAEEPAGPIAPDGVHAVAPSLPGNAESLVPTSIRAGPWRLCGGLASNCPIVTLSARPD